ncbi:helix-turn-helix transcriptional regulator [Streptomyces sp. ID03-2B]|uniref:Helix-turn-helix domain-containing protein n=1 Tax=Streptomyces caviscabies TaxID=90079 RepID=A0ABW2MMA0_9ACTN|nr:MULTISPECIES: helix-turn-helix transcriptional regulator [unclassified Streptomyces]MCL6289179.1 helix-turn-helix transcriptional regulator [Streptomyces sp. 43Y-GA-1]MDX3343581.1 helix-turn-helix transcriptional regulator [Streptomyces sp. ME02-6979.5a]MDX3506368.1 helix-turn-helix transcriptional regulator [Streptomyces sp. ATCC51928]MDX3589845.1 helix-turn-helix transcriptional regulator [Streptomyces sp. ID03-2B]MDX5522215.1 helix-turn-helix transcriptional regulator [Streptomyces sp. D
MKWNLRLAAAHRGIWKASELQRLLAEHGLVISAGKMSGLWSSTPASIKLSDLEVICVALGCEIAEVMTPEPENVTRVTKTDMPTAETVGQAAAPAVVPRSRGGRSLPPR